MTVRVLGLDLSTTSSGLAMPDGSCHTLRPRTKDDPARRLHEILVLAEPFLVLARAEVAVLEQPFAGRSLATLRKLAEVAGVIKARLHEHGVQPVDVSPSGLKMFATGGGAADKARMVRYAESYGAVVANDDEADAWLLRAMGLYAFGELVVPKEVFRDEAVAVVRWPRLTLKDPGVTDTIVPSARKG